MMSMLHLLWIVPLVAAVAWGFGYKANPERVRAFVKAHIVDEDPYQDEGHSATRYAPESGESPIAREARKAAEVGTARPEEIEAAKYASNPDKHGLCDAPGQLCGICPAFNECCNSGDPKARSEVARQWLLDHGINPDEASK